MLCIQCRYGRIKMHRDEVKGRQSKRLGKIPSKVGALKCYNDYHLPFHCSLVPTLYNQTSGENEAVGADSGSDPLVGPSEDTDQVTVETAKINKSRTRLRVFW